MTETSRVARLGALAKNLAATAALIIAVTLLVLSVASLLHEASNAPCADSIAIIRTGTDHTCPVGTRLHTQPMTTDSTQVTCLCRTTTNDGGAP